MGDSCEVNGPRADHRQSWRWKPEHEETFLACLASGMNVQHAIERIPFSTSAVYARRMRHPRFAEQWSQAIAIGYDRVEALLLENATRVLEGVATEGACPIPRMTVGEALALLGRYRTAMHGRAKANERQSPPIDPEAAREEILRNVAAVKRAREMRS